MAAAGLLVSSLGGGEVLPNIPGIRRHPVHAKRVAQTYKVVQGIMHEDPGNKPPPHPVSGEESVLSLDIFRSTAHVKESHNYTDLSGRYAMRNQKKDYANKVNNLPFGAEPQRLPRFLAFDKKALKYHAWYREAVPESAVETERLHKCDIYYYLENHTMQVVEHKQTNSGLPQGDLIKRLLIPKADGSGFYTDKDLYVGAQVELFGKVFEIVDANESTRQHMAGLGLPHGPALPYPADAYTSFYTAKMQRETGADPTISRNRKMHPMKEYMESILGKPVKMQDLGSFLEHDKQVLRFFTVWDDRDSLYGDLLRFKIHYYLVDDSMEIVPQFERNCGRDRIGKLLSRSKIVKAGAAQQQQAEEEAAANNNNQKEEGGEQHPKSSKAEQHYHWKDLTVGSKVTVFGRDLTILDADRFTRDFLSEQGRPLGPELVLPEDPVPKYARPIPPHTGYGSDEDTLKNCFSFDPKPPLKDGAKAILNSGKILRYGARILSNNKDDRMRFFVILFFMEDDTIAIREPPIRNSGFNGGNFLSRTKVMRNQDEKYEPYDLYVGAVVQMVAHKFEVINADDYTLNYMESRSHEGWPNSNIYKILDKIRPHTAQLRNIIVRLNHPTGRLSYQNINEAVRATGVKLDQQEEITLTRALDPLKKGIIPSYRLIKKLEAGPLY